ncbi:MAG TPA: succinate dehydrogenase, cytochrome b556 subunit [Vineibacter sp.]|nr:succinate dehydrogenase, cytochrome b556 subunit [Vineibacter sp.]
MSTADGPVSRPLSPHLTAYRPQLTSMMSITHRGTGIALAVGLAWLVVWICAAASDAATYGIVASFNGSILGRIFLFGWTASLFYHLFNGIRHLFWDAGYGLELKEAYASGWTVLAATAVCTIGSWLIASLVR